MAKRIEVTKKIDGKNTFIYNDDTKKSINYKNVIWNFTLGFLLGTILLIIIFGG